MSTRIYSCHLFVIFSLFVIAMTGCSKSDSPPPAADPCAGKTIVITATPQPVAACGNNGSITAAATGSSGFSFKLNASGTYQPGGNFTNLAAGDYTLFAKDAAGCEKSTAVTVASSAAAGPMFTAVKNLVAARCQGCHNNALANGGMNFQVECNIISNRGRIKVRAVDEGTMPQTGPLSQAEKDIIAAWITAGGGYTN